MGSVWPQFVEMGIVAEEAISGRDSFATKVRSAVVEAGSQIECPAQVCAWARIRRYPVRRRNCHTGASSGRLSDLRLSGGGHQLGPADIVARVSGANAVARQTPEFSLIGAAMYDWTAQRRHRPPDYGWGPEAPLEAFVRLTRPS